MNKQKKNFPTGSSGGGGKKGYGARKGGPYGLQEIRDNCRVSPTEDTKTLSGCKNKSTLNDDTKQPESINENICEPTIGCGATATNISSIPKISTAGDGRDLTDKWAGENIDTFQKPVLSRENFLPKSGNHLNVKYRKGNVKAFVDDSNKSEGPFAFGQKLKNKRKIDFARNKDYKNDFVSTYNTEKNNVNFNEQSGLPDGYNQIFDENLRGPDIKPTVVKPNDNNRRIPLDNKGNVAYANLGDGQYKYATRETGLKYIEAPNNVELNEVGENYSSYFVNCLPIESFGQRCSKSKEENTNQVKNNESINLAQAGVQNHNGAKENSKDEIGAETNNASGARVEDHAPTISRNTYDAQDRTFVFYIKKIERSYNTRQGTMLSRLLSLRDSHIFNIIPLFKKDYKAIINQECSLSQLTQALISHVECVKALLAREVEEAFNKQVSFSIFILHMLQTPRHRNEGWTLPLLYELAIDMRVISLKAATTMDIDLNNEVLELGAEVLLCCFRLCSIRRYNSKIAGRRIISNELIKLFFEMKKFDYRQPLMYKPYDSNFKCLYKIYTGSSAEFLKLAYADDYLKFAFKNCPQEYEGLINLILIRVEPIKILKGQTTPRHILQKHGLTFFSDLSFAVHTGNLIQFDTIVRVYSSFLSLHGIFNFINVEMRALAINNFHRMYQRGWPFQ